MLIDKVQKVNSTEIDGIGIGATTTSADVKKYGAKITNLQRYNTARY